MKRDEILRRMAAGARLRVVRTPWGSYGSGALLDDASVPGGFRLIPPSRLAGMLDSGVIQRLPDSDGLNSDFSLARKTEIQRIELIPPRLEEAISCRTHLNGDSEDVATPAISFAFQPIFDARTGRTIAHEALVRGADGSLAASVFRRVPADELLRFDAKCCCVALAQAQRLRLPGRLHLNAIPRPSPDDNQLAAACLARAGRERGFGEERLAVELKVSELPVRPSVFAHTARFVRANGLRLALCDYPLHVSQLGLLDRLRPHTIKLDGRSFSAAHRRSKFSMFVERISHECESRGIDLVVEKVERMEVFSWLQAAGVRFFQGQLFGGPAMGAANDALVPDIGSDRAFSASGEAWDVEPVARLQAGAGQRHRR